MAYNEEANIANTILSIIEGNQDIEPLIKVYANGCTDNTLKIVSRISDKNHLVELIEIEQPSKVNAWNLAFEENKNNVLIFSDGDVAPEPGSVGKILHVFDNDSDVEIACCKSWPDSRGQGWEQKFTGFMLTPLNQDFLTGHFYGIRRRAIAMKFKRLGVVGIPVGIVGEDAFLENIVSHERFVRIDSKVNYHPPVIKDYYKFLARMRWQSEQLQQFYRYEDADNTAASEVSLTKRIKRKFVNNSNFSRLLLGVTAASVRVLFMMIAKSKIEDEYRKLGPVTAEGSLVLSVATRSSSVK